MSYCCFFFNDTATTEIYTLSLHDALPIWGRPGAVAPLPALPSSPCTYITTARWSYVSRGSCQPWVGGYLARWPGDGTSRRSEEHTSELQSRQYLVCRLLLEKKNTQSTYNT